MRTCGKERQEKPPRDEHGKCRRQRRYDGTDAHTKTAEEDVPGSSVPVGHPDEESPTHLTDLADDLTCVITDSCEVIPGRWQTRYQYWHCHSRVGRNSRCSWVAR